MSNIKNIDDVEYLLEPCSNNKYKVEGVKDSRSGVSITRTANRVLFDNTFAKGMSADAADNLCIAWLAISKPDVLVFEEE